MSEPNKDRNGNDSDCNSDGDAPSFSPSQKESPKECLIEKGNDNYNNNAKTKEEEVSDIHDKDVSSFASSPPPSSSSFNSLSNDDGFVGWDHDRLQVRREASDNGQEGQQLEVDFENIWDDHDHHPTIQEQHENDGANDVHSQSFMEEEGDDDDDDDDDDENDQEEEKWSIRVRVNSAVDLPPSIVPSRPLCPLLKLGILTVRDEHELTQLEQASTTERRTQVFSFFPPPTASTTTGTLTSSSKHKQKSTTTTTISSNSSSSSSSTPTKTQTTITTTTTTPEKEHESKENSDNTMDIPSVSSFQVDTPLSSFGPEARVKLTSCKVTSLRDNGMMEWHEEMRWDDITLPLQTVLAVELCAKAIFPPVSGGASSGAGLYSDVASTRSTSTSSAMGGGGSTDYDSLYERARFNLSRDSHSHAASSSINSSTQFNNDNPESSQSSKSGRGGAILNFWRRGRRGLHTDIQQPIAPTSSTNSTLSDLRMGAAAGGANGGNGAMRYNSRTSSTTSLVTEQSDEMETASAAAAVARYLMSRDNSVTTTTDTTSSSIIGDTSKTNSNTQKTSTSSEVSQLSFFIVVLVSYRIVLKSTI